MSDVEAHSDSVPVSLDASLRHPRRSVFRKTLVKLFDEGESLESSRSRSEGFLLKRPRVRGKKKKGCASTVLMLLRCRLMIDIKRQGPRFIMVTERIFVADESMLRGLMLANVFSSFDPDVTFSARFLCPAQSSMTPDEVVVESAWLVATSFAAAYQRSLALPLGGGRLWLLRWERDRPS
ncbi:hypothetical protein ACLOJK_040907 [Asimina triloba]